MMRVQFILLIVCLFAWATHYGASAQQRIITAGSSSSEIVCALGLCDKIVATDRTSLYPESLQDLPSIGYRNSINAEGILSLEPDLVILEKSYVTDDLITQLRLSRIKVVVVQSEQNFESSKARIRTIAGALNKLSEAEQLIGQIEIDLLAISKKVASAPSRPKVLCVYARGTGAIQIAGSNTSFELLRLAGAVNAAADIEGYKPLNTESLIQSNPDFILFFDSGLESIGGVEGVLKIPGVSQTKAGKEKQIIHMDGNLLTNWGPRIAQAVEELFYLTHPIASR
jgi:iron complex transport system substrate-binding protein